MVCIYLGCVVCVRVYTHVNVWFVPRHVCMCMCIFTYVNAEAWGRCWCPPPAILLIFFFLNQGLTDLKALFQGYLSIKLFGSPVTVPLSWHYNHKQTGFLCRCWHSSLGPQACRAGTFFPTSSLTICGLKIFYFICLFCVCVYEKVFCSCESHRTTCRSWFSLLQCGSQGRPQVIKCGSKHLLSHLTGPTW